jgi:hypothetical protein
MFVCFLIKEKGEYESYDPIQKAEKRRGCSISLAIG